MRAVVPAVVATLLAAGCSFQAGNTTASGDTDADVTPGDGSIDAMVTMVDGGIDAPPDAPPLPPVTASFPVTQDTYLDSVSPNTNFGSTGSMLTDGGGQPATSLFRVDLTDIPTTATVTSVELHIWTSTDTGGAVSLYRLLQSWVEGEATWNERADSTAWSAVGAGGASRDTTVLATLTPDAADDEKVVSIPTAVVQDWVTTPATNFGIAIATTSNDGSTLQTRNASTAAERPYLLITYQP